MQAGLELALLPCADFLPHPSLLIASSICRLVAAAARCASAATATSDRSRETSEHVSEASIQPAMSRVFESQRVLEKTLQTMQPTAALTAWMDSM